MDAEMEYVDELCQAEASQSDSQNSNTVPSEGSTTGGTEEATHDEDDGRAAVDSGLASAVFELPSEARFKQLASLHLLRATYREEERGDVDRISLERVLQSARRQNAAQKIRLAYLQEQVSHQLRITEAQEGRLGELLQELQSLSRQSADLSSREDTVLHIVEAMNDVRAGSPREMPGFMELAASMGRGVELHEDATAIPSFFKICKLFTKGLAPSSYLQFTLAPLDERLHSLEAMSHYSPDLMFKVLSIYKEPVISLLQQVGSSDPDEAGSMCDPEEVAQALIRLRRLADELYCWCSCFIIGQPSTYAIQNPWWRTTPMATIPLDAMQDALDEVGLRREQLAAIQQRWHQHHRSTASLLEAELGAKEHLRSQLKLTTGVTDCHSQFLPLMGTVAQLKAFRIARANSAFQLNCSVAFEVMDPLQFAHMTACMAPYPFRADMMLAAGLMQPSA